MLEAFSYECLSTKCNDKKRFEKFIHSCLFCEREKTCIKLLRKRKDNDYIYWESEEEEELYEKLTEKLMKEGIIYHDLSFEELRDLCFKDFKEFMRIMVENKELSIRRNFYLNLNWRLRQKN